MKRKKKKGVDTWKSKNWFSIKAPKSLEEKELGVTATNEPEKLVGRTVKTTLRELTGNVSQQHIQINFKVSEVKGKEGRTIILGHEMQRSYVGRLSKRMKSVMQAIAPYTTKDGFVLQTTVLVIARKKMNSKQRTAVRKKVIEFMAAHIEKTSFEKFFQEAVFGKLSTEIFKVVKKVYPVSRIEITKTRVLSGKGVPEAVEEKEEVEVIPAEEKKPKKKVVKKKEEAPIEEKPKKKLAVKKPAVKKKPVEKE